jgi:hypothetical protein
LAEYRDKEAEFDKIDYLGDPDYETKNKKWDYLMFFHYILNNTN